MRSEQRLKEQERMAKETTAMQEAMTTITSSSNPYDQMTIQAGDMYLTLQHAFIGCLAL